MSAQEPDMLTLNEDFTPLNLEGYEDFFSSYWITQSTIESVLDLIDTGRISDEAETIVYTDENPQNNIYPFQVSREIIETEQVRFFRLNTQDYSVTWEDAGMEAIIGHISTFPSDELLLQFYEQTADIELGLQQSNQLMEFLSRYE